MIPDDFDLNQFRETIKEKGNLNPSDYRIHEFKIKYITSLVYNR